MLILIEMDFNGGRGGGYHEFFLVSQLWCCGHQHSTANLQQTKLS